MKTPRRPSSQGFTLIEIMVIVMIIGMLAALAIPSFNRMRKRSRQTIMINDARQLGLAAQQYFLSTAHSAATIQYDSSTGIITGDLSPWIKHMTSNYVFSDAVIESGSTAAFTFTLPSAFSGTAVTFTDEGRTDLRDDAP